MASCDSVVPGQSFPGVPDKQMSKSKEVPATGGNSVWLTAGIIVADVVGAGILGMPSAVAHFGWALGVMVLVILLAANVHVSILLWRVRMSCPGCDGASTYMELTAGAFASAADWQRRLAVRAAGISQYSFILGLLGIYLLSAGRGLGMLFYRAQVCLPKWSLLAGLVLLPFAGTGRSMGSYPCLIWINIITLCGTICIPLLYYVVAGVEDIKPVDSGVYAFAALSPAGVLSGLSIFTFGLTSQFMLTEIISEMKDPSALPKAYAGISAPFQLVAFLVSGLGGYVFIGDKVTGMINENLPFGIAFQIAAACLVTHMAISYLIKGVVLSKALHAAVDAEYSDASDTRSRSLFLWNCIVAATLLLAWVLANVVPFFGDLVDLLGASFTPLSCWVIPIALFVRWYWDAGEEKPDVSKLEWVIIACEVVLAFILMFFGTWSSIANIVEKWHTYGYPFECHCEGMWNTCVCSADHIGMSDWCQMPGEV